MESERIYQAAIRMNDGEIFTGCMHGDAWYHAQRAGYTEDGEDGFMTFSGRFVTREEAHEIVCNCPGKLISDYIPGGM